MHMAADRQVENPHAEWRVDQRSRGIERERARHCIGDGAANKVAPPAFLFGEMDRGLRLQTVRTLLLSVI